MSLLWIAKTAAEHLLFRVFCYFTEMAELKYSPLLAQTRLLWFHWTKKWLPSENSTFLPVFYRPIWTFFINLTSLSFNCFLKADGEISYKEGLMKSQIFGPRCFRDLLPLTVEASCQMYPPSVAARVAWKWAWFTEVNKWSKLTGILPSANYAWTYLFQECIYH